MPVAKLWNSKVNRTFFCLSSLRGCIAFMLLASLVCIGCRKEEITAYRIPKEPPAGLANASQSATSGAGQLPLTFKTPNGWQPQQPTGMGLASFGIADRKAELSVMSFPGEGAGRLDLVNIVRGNMGLPPLNDAELAKLVEPVEVGGEKGSLINLSRGTGTSTNFEKDSIMVAVVPHAGVTWFFKLAGVSDVVAAQKPNLLAFLKSVAFTPEAAMPASPHGESFASANSGSVPAASPAALPASAPDASANKPAWQVPTGWKEVPPTQMLLAKFIITGSNGEADVTVSSFPGSVGGALPNVNRWRGQVGLDPIGEGDLDKSVASLDVNGGKAMLVDVKGKSPKTGKETRLIGVILPREGETWFYKLMGDGAVAGSQKDAFLKFVQSARYSNG